MRISVVADGHPNPQRQKWNERYSKRSQINPIAQVLSDNLHLLPQAGKALELACGLGGNALALARLGFETHAWDLSDIAIERLQQQAEQHQLPLQALCIDLEQQPIPAAQFDLILVSGYLERRLCPQVAAALKPAGLLLYQTFTLEKTQPGGPSSPDFLLKPGELLQLFACLEPIVYREERNCGALDQGLRNQAYLVARKPG